MKRPRVRMPSGNIVRGLYELASGKTDGIRQFGTTTDAFYASIAPWLAFPIVNAAFIGLTGHWRLGALIFLSRICSVLLQPVIVQWCARLTGHRGSWLLTSTALNWSLWLVFPLIFIGVVVSGGLITLGVPSSIATDATAGLIVAYLFWVQWLILRTGLRIGRLLALAILFGMTIAVGLVYACPFLLHPELIKLILPHPSGH